MLNKKDQDRLVVSYTGTRHSILRLLQLQDDETVAGMSNEELARYAERGELDNFLRLTDNVVVHVTIVEEVE